MRVKKDACSAPRRWPRPGCWSPPAARQFEQFEHHRRQQPAAQHQRRAPQPRGLRPGHDRRRPDLQQHRLLGRLHQLRAAVRAADAHQAARPAALGRQRQPAEPADRAPGERGRPGHRREPGDGHQPRPGDQLRDRAPRPARLRRHDRRRRPRLHGRPRLEHRCTGRTPAPTSPPGEVRLRARPGGRPHLIQRRRPHERLRLLHGRQRPGREGPQGPDRLDGRDRRHRRAGRDQRLRLAAEGHLLPVVQPGHRHHPAAEEQGPRPRLANPSS